MFDGDRKSNSDIVMMTLAVARMIQTGAWQVRDPDAGGSFRVRNAVGAGLCGCVATALLIAPACTKTLGGAPSITPASMARIGTVDERFQSYNIEMIEITGGRFWKPYRPAADAQSAQPQPTGSDTPPGKDSNLYQYRPPIALTND